VKHFSHFLNEKKFVIPPNEIDNLLYKTIEIVNNDVKKNLKYERDIEQGNLHLSILQLLQKEWDKKRVETNFVFRITDKIFRIHSGKKNFWSDIELG
jgi:hypothetical protein